MSSITFAGAAGEVTGSSFLIKSKGNNYLVDCGLFQGQEFSKLNTKPFPFNPSEINNVIITHAHLDHVGRLPKLVKDGYRGDIYTTPATAQLIELVLNDAFNVMLEKVERNEGVLLYEKTDLNRAISFLKPLPYYQRHNLRGDDGFVLYDAGHILGSSSALIDLGEEKIVFSGDLGHWPEPLLPMPSPPPSADIVVMEATYGGREHDDSHDRITVLKEALDWTIAHKGVLLIPAFAIERSQELLYIFHRLFEKYHYPRIPIYLDSPLAIETLEVFNQHCELFSKDVKDRCGNLHDLFNFKGLVLASSVEDSKSINDDPKPKIILAGSGMMEGGRIAYHLRKYLPDPSTYLLIVGFQAEGTIGRQIALGNSHVRLFDEDVTIRAKVVSVDNFSSHADNSDLLKWVKDIQGVKKVFIVHSDPDCARNFCENVKKAEPGLNVEIAAIDETKDI